MLTINPMETVNKFLKAFCTNHSGKMEGMTSLSTACTANKYCIARAKDPKSICSHCYAQTLLKCRTALDNKCIRNGEFLKERVFEKSELPLVNNQIFRLEAFGDLETVFQFVNYVNLAKKNPHCTFSLWTKNYFIVELACKLYKGLYNEKKHCFSQNFILIVSSPYMNTELDIDKYPMADKVFTVYEKEYAESHNVKINCGARKCMQCRRCYTKRTGKYVHELKK